MELFARSSPEDVTIDRIAAAAGISNRTFFRYFATRDEVLAALPRRSLGRVSELVRARPASESVLQAFTEAEKARRMDPSESELVLLWGIVVERSPIAANRALAHSAVSSASTYQQLIAERTGADRNDPAVGAMAAAITGVISYAFGRWMLLGGRAPLGPMIADALTVLRDIDAPPEIVSSTSPERPDTGQANRGTDPATR